MVAVLANGKKKAVSTDDVDYIDISMDGSAFYIKMRNGSTITAYNISI